MHWLILQSDQQTKLASLPNKATVGSAVSNHIVVQGRGVRPLHGQFLLQSSGYVFRDFQDRILHVLTNSNSFSMGEWKAEVRDSQWLEAHFESQLLQAFKSFLKSQSSLSPEAALSKLESEFFLNAKLPVKLRQHLLKHYQELSLLSPIEALLEDPYVTDILVEDFDQIWMERSGELQISHLSFTNPEGYRLYIENLLTQLHKTVDEAQPYIDFILPQGSRGHLIGPPLTNGKTYLSIRKIRETAFSLDELCRRGMFTESILAELQQLLREKKNVLISGATGSGKTSLLKALLQEVPKKERVLIIEDTPELVMSRANAAFLCSRPSSQELPPVSLRELVRQSLRMRPDRIIVGEVRGEEALDLMHAMNTGHRGCFGSLHANSCRDALYRLQGLIQMASASLSEEVTRDLIANNLHCVLHLARSPSGERKLAQIGTLQGLDASRFVLEVKEL